MDVDNTREAVREMLAGGKLGEVATRFTVDKGTLSKLVKGAQMGIELKGVDNTGADVFDHGVNVDNNCEACEQVKALTTRIQELETPGVDNGNVDNNCETCERVQALTTQLEAAAVDNRNAVDHDCEACEKVQELTTRVQELEAATVDTRDADSLDNEALTTERISALEQENALLRKGLPEGVTLEDLAHWEQVEAYCNSCDIGPMDLLDRWVNWLNSNKALRQQLLKAHEIIRNKNERIAFLSEVNAQVWPLIDRGIHKELAKFEKAHGIVLPPDPYADYDYPVSLDDGDGKGGPEAPGPHSHAAPAVESAPATGPRIRSWSTTVAASDAPEDGGGHSQSSPDDYPDAGQDSPASAVESVFVPAALSALGFTAEDLDDMPVGGWYEPPVTVKPTKTPARVNRDAGGSWLDKLGNRIEELFR